MRVVKSKKTWMLLTASILITIIVTVIYLDYKTDQMMTLASSKIVEVLAPQAALLPKVDEATEAASPQSEATGASGITQSDTQAASRPERNVSQTASPVKQSANTEDKNPSNTVIVVETKDVTLLEKAKAYKLASSKLSAKEINALMQWSQGGLTETEKESAKSLFYSRFSVEEQQWILGLFNKYN